MNKRLSNITCDFVREVLEYFPDTGIFIWKIDSQGGNKAGDVAGSLDKKSGYVRIRINRKTYAAHRLAWLHVTGAWPENDLDHKDGKRDNNKFENLRLATKSQNARYKRGARGYYWNAVNKRWLTRIRINRKQLHIGSFEREEDARQAYLDAAEKHGLSDWVDK